MGFFELTTLFKGPRLPRLVFCFRNLEVQGHSQVSHVRLKVAMIDYVICRLPYYGSIFWRTVRGPKNPAAPLQVERPGDAAVFANTVFHHLLHILVGSYHLLDDDIAPPRIVFESNGALQSQTAGKIGLNDVLLVLSDF